MPRRPVTDEDLNNLGGDGINRKVKVRVYGDREVFAQEEIEYETDQGMEAINWIREPVCDMQHPLSQENPLTGSCKKCGRILCARDDCSYKCAGCEALLCTEHALLVDDEIFCSEGVQQLRHERLRSLVVTAVRVIVVWVLLILTVMWLLPF